MTDPAPPPPPAAAPPPSAAAPVSPDAPPVDAPPGGGQGQGPLDLQALEEHFAGYRIVDPATVALTPVTLVAPPPRPPAEGG